MKNIRSIGFWSGLLAFLATISYVIVQLLQVLRMIPFPTDEILIYGLSLCIVIPFVIEILSLHYVTPGSKRFWTHGALLFTSMYAVFVSANYVVQLVTVIPMKLRGMGNEIRILDQTPHSLFWNFDALGYIFMGLAMLMAIPAFEKKGSQKKVRWALFANGLMTPIISIVYFYPRYSENLLMLGLPWAITAPLAMLMLALFFRRKENTTA
jgi:hypothetical protein